MEALAALDSVNPITTADLEKVPDLEDLRVALVAMDLEVLKESLVAMDLEVLKESPVVTMEAQDSLAVPAVLYVLTSPEQTKTC